MNKIIEKELKKIIVPSKLIEEDVFLFKKTNKIIPSKNKTYLIKTPQEILNNINVEYLKIIVTNITDTKIKVDSIGYDIKNNKDILKVWSGWLDFNIEIIKEI